MVLFLVELVDDGFTDGGGCKDYYIVFDKNYKTRIFIRTWLMIERQTCMRRTQNIDRQKICVHCLLVT